MVSLSGAGQYSTHNIVLLAHLGGFKEYEKKFDSSQGTAENSDFFYKNHLGRLGLAKLVEAIQPKICIISELGEEFKRTRLKLTNIFQDVYSRMIFIAADIGLCLDTACKVKLIKDINHDSGEIKHKFFPCSELAMCERRLDSSLHYYKKSAINEADLREFLTNRYHQRFG